MENRVLVAVSMGAVMLIIFSWLMLRNMRERWKFRLRQQGRGKNTAAAPAE